MALSKRRGLSSISLLLFACLVYRGAIIAPDVFEVDENDSFRADKLDLAKQVPCGQYKCFFRSKSDPGVGYLVAPSQRKMDTTLKWFETLEAGWQLSQDLEKKCAIQHFLLEPPTKFKVSSDLAKRLNKNLYSEKREKVIRGKNSKRFPKGSIAFMQKVKTAPKKGIVIGCADSKLVQFKKNANKFAKSIKYVNNFGRNWSEGLATAKQLIETEPCLTKDFQVLVDEKGNFYHLDFDRCFLPDASGQKYQISREETTSCLEALDELQSRVQRHLSRIWKETM